MGDRLKGSRRNGLSGGGRSQAQALYLYGLSQPGAAKRDIPGSRKGIAPKNGTEVVITGIDGRNPVRALECAGLLAWTSEVEKRFAAELADKMEDLEWLTEASVEHQRVVAAIAVQVELLPARLGTVFLGMQSLEADIRSRKKQLMGAFQRIADAEEWGIKVFVAAAAVPAARKATSGKDYLQIKARAIEAKAKPGADEEIERLEAALAKIARASTVAGKVSSGLKGLRWQATFLVPRNRREQWDMTLKRFAGRWNDSRRIECTGPWPPYSFVGD